MPTIGELWNQESKVGEEILGEYALRLMMARLRAEESKDEKWLSEISTRIKELVDYCRWRFYVG